MEETTGRRDRIALYLIGFSFFAIVLISVVLIYYNDKDSRAEASTSLFNSLLPLISTWVGTVLVFYFGRENFESASKRYEQIINKLSPEVLAGITAKQVMIDTFTMVSIDEQDVRLTTFNAQALLDFLDSIKKSRLPILAGNIPKYVVHRSLIAEEIRLHAGANPARTLQNFLAENPIVKKFGSVKENDKVELARKQIQDNELKDVFVLNDKGEVVGWLTDTHILRYMTTTPQ